MFRFLPDLLRTVLTFAASVCAATLSATTVVSITTGPYPVGSTNFEVRALSSNSEMEQRLIGSYSSSGDVYIADLLVHPADCPSIDIDFPKDVTFFGRHSGQRTHFVAYIVYPTTDSNTRPDYVFPYTNTGDHTFPHMQRTGEAPLLRDTRVRYPLILYSTGYNAHGLWDLGHMKLLASQGYIVMAIQHGDGRNSFQGCFGERPITVSRFLDYILAHPVFGPAIDRERIGMSGTSMGGYTTLSVVGGGYNGSALVPKDKRFYAAFGLVPYVGGNYGYYPFGSDYGALANVTCPFFAVYAERDASVPKYTVEAALPKIQGSCAGVILMGQTHSLIDAGYREGQTYEILFFNAWLKDDKDAMETLYGDMQGGEVVDDRRTYLHLVSSPVVDESVFFGDCPQDLRLSAQISGSKIIVRFPSSTSSGIRYDLMGSSDLLEWQCLRSTEVDASSVTDGADWVPGNGFRWRALALPGSVTDLTKPLFFRVRVSQ